MKKTRAVSRSIADDVRLGANVQIHNSVNLYGCEIGANSRIGAFVEIQTGAKIGKNCKISSHSFVCEGVRVEDDVFIGHHVVFINDPYPRAVNKRGKLQTSEDWRAHPTVVERGASIGSGAVILCDVTVGTEAIVGAGSVVTKDVPPRAIVAGNPARVIRVVEQGSPSPASSGERRP